MYSVEFSVLRGGPSDIGKNKLRNSSSVTVPGTDSSCPWLILVTAGAAGCEGLCAGGAVRVAHLPAADRQVAVGSLAPRAHRQDGVHRQEEPPGPEARGGDHQDGKLVT